MPIIVKNTTSIGLLDLIAPHSCRGCGQIGEVLCGRCKNYILNLQQNLCPKCKASNPTGFCSNCNNQFPTFIGGERVGLLDTVIHDYKYHSIRALAKPLAEIMRHALPNDISKTQTYLVPLPTITPHIRARGFDHTLFIAKHLSKLIGCQLDPIIFRTKNTVQVGTNRDLRQTQAKSAYSLKKAPSDIGANYILFDDVWTTGASMNACTSLLQRAGITNLTIAILSLSRLT